MERESCEQMDKLREASDFPHGHMIQLGHPSFDTDTNQDS